MALKVSGKVCHDGMSLAELISMDPNFTTTERWFAERRWGGEPWCPYCGSLNIQSGAKHNTMPYRCRDKECRKRFSVKTGTIMEGSNLNYQTWAKAIYLITTYSQKVSSMKLHSDLKVTEKSARHLANRLRKAWARELASFSDTSGKLDSTQLIGSLMENTIERRQVPKEVAVDKSGSNAEGFAEQPNFLPREVTPKAPPIKMQGIKTKIVPLIARSITWSGEGRWIEPFFGSGVVALNIAPERALLADTNRHVINLYKSIQEGTISGQNVRAFLEREGRELRDKGESHYYSIRERFNNSADPFDFIFLSRACFNGMMRFNQSGKYNVPFCRKPERFRPSLVTKISNQVDWASRMMQGKDWHFIVQDWRSTIADAKIGDLIYCDPPYIGRHTDYYNGFTDEDGDVLANALIETSAGFALSMWLENKYRRNDYVGRWFSGFPQRTMSHFYHVGASESLRNQMTEVVILSKQEAMIPNPKKSNFT